MTQTPDLYLSANPSWSAAGLSQSYASGAWPDAQEAPTGRVAMGLMIWIPAILAALTLLVIGQAVPAILVAGGALLLHSLFVPRVAVYALIASLPVEWMVAVLPGITTGTKILGLLAMLLSLMRIATVAIPTNWDRSGKWMIGLIAWSYVTIIWCVYPSLAFKSAVSLTLTWGIPVLICVHFRTTKDIHWLIRVYVLANIATCLMVFARGDLLSVTESAARAEFNAIVGGEDSGHSLNVNSVARSFATSAIMCTYLFIVNRNLLVRILIAGAIAILGVGIILTKARAVYLSLPLAMVGTIVLLGGAGVVKRVILGGVIGILGGSAGFVLMKLGLLGEGVVQRFESIFEEGFEAGSRDLFWTEHLTQFVNTGFIGRGYAQAAVLPEFSYHVAHNDWISIAGTLGIIGLVCFFMFHLTLILRIRHIGNLWTKMFCLMAWCFLMCAALTQDDYVHKHYTVVIGFMIALIGADQRERQRLGLSHSLS